MLKYISAISALSLLAGGCSPNQEGDVRIADCREQITTSPDSWDALTNSYTCVNNKDKDGNITSSLCSRVELNSNGQCNKSWTFFTK